MRCNDEHNFQPPYTNNNVDASKAVWKALGISKAELGYGDYTSQIK